MLGLFPPASERRLLAADRRFGPTSLVIAAITFVMVIVGSAGLALANAADMVARGVESRFVIQLPAGSDGLEEALGIARRTPGVAAVEPVPEESMRRTLEQWIGPAGGAGELPVPALLMLDLSPGADPAAIGRRLERAIAGARFVAHRDSLEPLLRSLRLLQWLTLGLVMLMAMAASAAVVLAARGALDTHRATIDVLHGIGATDEQVTRLFQRQIGLEALAGGLAGGAAAGAVLLILAGVAAGWVGELAGPALGIGDALLLAALPLLAVLLATLVARIAVLGALRRAL